MKANTLTWLVLISLTLVSYLASDSLLGRSATIVILLTAGLKCVTLAWRFMEVGHAHAFWRAALLAILAALGMLILRA